MKKDTYYFSHDANAKDDPKCMHLIDDLGMEGYGIFWVLIETLRNQPDYKCPLSILKSIARQYNTTLPKVEVVVKNYGLFTIDDETFFFSESLLRRMQIADSKRNMLSDAGKKGNTKRWNLSPPDRHPIATQSQLKERKVKEIKLKENKINENKEEQRLPLPFSSIEFSNIWDILLKQPKWKNKTHHALQLNLKKLAEHDELTAIKMIENTISGGWQGIFQLDKKDSNNGNLNQFKPNHISGTINAYDNVVRRLNNENNS